MASKRAVLYEDLILTGLSVCRRFINWQNEENICWLNSALSVIVHNRVLLALTKYFPDVHVSKMIKNYFSAMQILNSEENQEQIEKVREMLRKIQADTSEILQSRMHHNIGTPDSAHLCLMNLLSLDDGIKHFFNIAYCVVRECQNCGIQLVSDQVKPIITLTKVLEFSLANPVSLCRCVDCGTDDQLLKFLYQRLPPVMIFHFENGAGVGYLTKKHYYFTTQEKREYELCAVITREPLENNAYHFITYIRYSKRKFNAAGDKHRRDSYDEKWLDCNDLQNRVFTFNVAPRIDLGKVCIYVYRALSREKFCDLGVVVLREHVIVEKYPPKIPEIIDLGDE